MMRLGNDNVDVEIGNGELWISIRGADDLRIIRSNDGHTEIAIAATPETMRRMAHMILLRLGDRSCHSACTPTRSSTGSSA